MHFFQHIPSTDSFFSYLFLLSRTFTKYLTKSSWPRGMEDLIQIHAHRGESFGWDLFNHVSGSLGRGGWMAINFLKWFLSLNSRSISGSISWVDSWVDFRVEFLSRIFWVDFWVDFWVKFLSRLLSRFLSIFLLAEWSLSICAAVDAWR